MATVRPFKAVRPKADYAEKVISLPYDVMNRHEAKEMAEGNPQSFLHITRAEIDLDDSISQYDDRVYLKGKENLDRFIEEGTLIREACPSFYIYKQKMLDNVQTGLVATVSVDEYENNVIKKHELTRVEKEMDRIRHFDVCNANTEPVFLTYRGDKKIDSLLSDWMGAHKPEYNFTTPDGVSHSLWLINDESLINSLQDLYKEIPSLYIADGHHRSASAYKVGKEKDSQESKYFMAVLFPDYDLNVYDYNRVVKDLNGLDKSEFLDRIEEKFYLTEMGKEEYKPRKKHEFSMYLDGLWYHLEVKPDYLEVDDIIEGLDVSLLQNLLLDPVLGIKDPRTDNRIDFIGGIRGMSELKRRAEDDMRLAFAVFPVTVDELIEVSDQGKIMPPKSTWFEPKLGSGLFLHEL